MVALPADHVRRVHRVRRLRDLRAFQGSALLRRARTSRRSTRRASATASRARSDFGQPFGWWPLSPALIILIFPLGFRLTCYYYRKAYYRSFWLSPPACAVAEPHKAYTGETRLPLILQNIHRYFWYAAVLVALILTYDAVLAFRDEDGDWGHMGLGTLILLVNVVLIWLYTLSCHSCRHIVGGRLRHFSQAPGPLPGCGPGSRKLNASHARYAWLLAVLGRVRRPLRLPARHRRDRRPEVLLMTRSTGTR